MRSSASGPAVSGQRSGATGPRITAHESRPAVLGAVAARRGRFSGRFQAMGQGPRAAGLTGKHNGGSYPQWRASAGDQLLTSAARNRLRLLNS